MFPPLHSAALQLHRLALLRWFLVVGQLIVIFVSVYGLRVALPLEGMIAVCLLLGAVNAATHWRQQLSFPVTSGELFAQICIDMVALAVLLYFSGGSANPFVSLLLLPLTIAATMLSGIWVGALALLTFAAYSLLLRWNLPLPPSLASLQGLDALVSAVTGVDRVHLSHDGGFAFHLIGMWINFAVSVLIVAVFVARLAATLRERERELARARERTLRQEQILALGTLAAGAAHQLGTPLSTMAVLVRDLELDHAASAPLNQDLALLREQVDRCKAILKQLVADAADADAGSPLTAAALLARVADEWRLLRPACTLSVRMQAGPSPRVFAARTLDQALLNLLDNAADASPAGIEIDASWDARECRIDILDRGPGIDRSVAERIGEPFVSTKREAGGMGLGLFLTNATVENLGGRVELFARAGGGARTRVVLPCAGGGEGRRAP
ncbi:MAG: ATP-binding protein [Rhodocyclaceae bacterium]|jgi:two-component system sensor histidine kinase RegB|nr:ATP-binding protein [Rhodocyclaceae bacterium]